MSLKYKVIIPARFSSTRLPGKPLLDIGGKPLIQYVYESALASRAEQVIIATDDARIAEAATGFGAKTLMTSPDHNSGTDRITEAVTLLGEPDDGMIVNVQGDEYGLPPAIIDQLANALYHHASASMATLCEKITESKQFHDPNAVKVVVAKDGSAIYFSRAPIPWYGKSGAEAPQNYPYPPYLHIGVYAYRAGFLKTYSALPHCPLERSEKLEQLRAIYHGYKIHVEEACDSCGIGVDTEADLQQARKQQQQIVKRISS